jgi:acyl-CoA thioesterase-2
VNARQDGKVIFTLSASFHRDEFGRDFQSPIRAVTPPPAPDWVDPIRHRASGMGIDVIDCTAVEPESLPAFLGWTRARGKVIEDRVLDACIMAYMSDMGPGGVTATAVGLNLDGGMDSIAAMASIDHAMWFHRASQSHEWMLIDATPVSVAGSRGLIRGTMHDAEGRHLASFAQELLVRERR